MSMEPIDNIRMELEALRSRVEEESLARARERIEQQDRPVHHTPKIHYPAFHTRMAGVGGFDKVIVTGGYAVTRSGRFSYGEITYTITENCELFARYQIAIVAGGAIWEQSASPDFHVIQKASSLPAHDAGYVLIPIASITFNSTDNRVSGVTIHHTGTLCHIEMPAGIIGYVLDTITTAPPGWRFADGSDAGPDIRDLFIASSGSTFAAGASGGNLTHQHDTVSYLDTSVGEDVASGADTVRIKTINLAIGPTSNVSHVPPWKAYAVVVKL